MTETSDRFELFFDRLKKPSNAIVLILGVGLLVDLYLGGPGVRYLLTLQLKLLKLDPDASNFKILTVFGEFRSLAPVVRNIDLWGGLLLTGLPILSYVNGLIQSLAIQKIK